MVSVVVDRVGGSTAGDKIPSKSKRIFGLLTRCKFLVLELALSDLYGLVFLSASCVYMKSCIYLPPTKEHEETFLYSISV